MSVPQAVVDLRAIVEQTIAAHPRTLQPEIGPSELGTGCDRCLIHKLAGTPTVPRSAPWLPTLGTAIHEWLETAILAHLAATGTDRWIPEGHVCVGDVAGVPVWGHSDVLDRETGTVVDFKLVGTTTLRKVTASGPSVTYVRQAHLYGKGWEDAGHRVEQVAIWYLPRNAVTLDGGTVWSQPYDRAVAETALARADMLARAIATFGADTVLASAPPHTGDEFSCADYPDFPARNGREQFADLLAG